MVEQETIKKKLRDFITDTFMIGNDIDSFEDNDSFMELDLIDSTGVLELTSFIEDEFGITIDDEEMNPDNLDSLDNLTNFISRKQG